MKKTLIGLFALCAFAMIPIVEAAEPATQPNNVKDFIFKQTKEAKLKVHVHFPKNWKQSDKRPAVVFFFGGGWHGGSANQFTPQAEYLATRGMVAVRADYRVYRRHKVLPDKCVEDAKSAIRWVRKNAADLGIDPNRIVASGGSAGGHLAACTGLTDGLEAPNEDLSVSSKPQALVLFNPVVDMTHEKIIQRLKGNKTIAQQISPFHQMKKNAPPTLILFGTADKLFAQVPPYLAKAKKLGNRVELYTAEGAIHGFFNKSPWYERTLRRMDEFLIDIGYLKGNPTIKATPVKRKSASRPNILVILADDLGFKDVGYHDSEIHTPHLDKLAQAGVRFEQFYVQPVCSPTRAALMTGRYPIRHGLQVGVIRPWAQYGLPLAERTLPQALKDVGYHTVMAGKWHLGCHEKAYLPNQRGFDHHYGHYLGMIDYFKHDRMGGLDWHRNGRTVREEGYTTNLIGDETVQLIMKHDRSKPLFAYVAFNAPHTPLQVPENYRKRYSHIVNFKRRLYAAMVTCLDDNVGRILDALKKRDMLDQTLIVFSSDNGGPIKSGANNGALRAGKGTIYEGGVRVPALAVWPGKLKAGTVTNEPMHIVDWYPTLLKLTGASLDQPQPLDGLDIWPTIADGKPSPHADILNQLDPNRAAIRRGPWKLVVHNDPELPTTELFNIMNDPNEQNNLAGTHPEKVTELKNRLEQYAKQAVEPQNNKGSKKPKNFKTPKVWGEFAS